MPGLGGIEILRRMKLRHPIPVIVISGSPDRYEDVATKIGAFAFFSKPFSLADLKDAVWRALTLRQSFQPEDRLQPVV